jgi:hypothetical protein
MIITGAEHICQRIIIISCAMTVQQRSDWFGLYRFVVFWDYENEDVKG